MNFPDHYTISHYIVTENPQEKPIIESIYEHINNNGDPENKYGVNATKECITEIINIFGSIPGVTVNKITEHSVEIQFSHNINLNTFLGALKQLLPENGLVLREQGYVTPTTYREYLIEATLRNHQLQPSYGDTTIYHDTNEPLTMRSFISKEQMETIKEKSEANMYRNFLYDTSRGLFGHHRSIFSAPPCDKKRTFQAVSKATFFLKMARASSEDNLLKKLPSDLIPLIANASREENVSDAFTNETIKLAQEEYAAVMKRVKK